tara:strand:- start:2194 stop:2493 length:300 start_codon:yes stop_codon:yes gene_type:complete
LLLSDIRDDLSALTGAFIFVVHLYLPMEQQMVLISREQCEHQIAMLQRAIHYCTHAKSSFDPTVDLNAEPTETYPGASGYALSAMKNTVCALESHMLYS